MGNKMYGVLPNVVEVEKVTPAVEEVEVVEKPKAKKPVKQELPDLSVE